MIDLNEIAGQRPEIYIEKVDIGESFIDLAARFASDAGTVLLMSGGDLECSRYHILGLKPWIFFMGRGRRISISSLRGTLDLDADPFDALRMILERYHIESSSLLPITAGLMGYLSYDLKDHIERLPRTSMDDLGLPQICLVAPSVIFIHDKKEVVTWLCSSRKDLSRNKDLLSFLKHRPPILKTCISKENRIQVSMESFSENMTKDEYISSVEKIRGYIASGDVYQVNFAQRFEGLFKGDSFDLFKNCYQENPAPFFAYINAGNHRIVSTSPERFICRNGADIETRPIKGTRPRGRNSKEDHKLREELENSQKDDAELSMIVDLMRNDLGKVCESGTVHVTRHKMVEEYQNVFHMVSTVKGRMCPQYDSVDLIRATFPGGSITGCPKIRAMEIIDELEPSRRHVYTGSIGYLSFHDTLDLSIAIRTALIYNDKISFSSGGGIVYDSDPYEEYNETIYKGRTLMRIKNDTKGCHQEEMAWVNGMIRPVCRASIKVSDLGFQYGFGFFETIRYSRGTPCYLEEHIRRFNHAWNELFQDECPDLSWNEIIDQVIDANRLQDRVSAIKIMTSWGTRMEPPYDHTVAVTARPYTHRMSGKDAVGLRLAVYPYPRQSPLADHKTLNYAVYYLAGRWAEQHGADESLILNPDKSISETNTANIILIKGGTAFRTSSPNSLPGIMERKVSDLLASWGYGLKRRRIYKEDLLKAETVLLTNSLMGAVPAVEIDEKGIEYSKDICKKINDMLL